MNKCTCGSRETKILDWPALDWDGLAPVKLKVLHPPIVECLKCNRRDYSAMLTQIRFKVSANTVPAGIGEIEWEDFLGYVLKEGQQ